MNMRCDESFRPWHHGAALAIMMSAIATPTFSQPSSELSAGLTNNIENREFQVSPEARWQEVLQQYERRASLAVELIDFIQEVAPSKDRASALAFALAHTIPLRSESTVFDREEMARFAHAQALVGHAIRQLLSAKIPRQSDVHDRFVDLESMMEGTQNRIAIACRDYNRAAEHQNAILTSAGLLQSKDNDLKGKLMVQLDTSGDDFWNGM
jgi:LemA protein